MAHARAAGTPRPQPTQGETTAVAHRPSPTSTGTLARAIAGLLLAAAVPAGVGLAAPAAGASARPSVGTSGTSGTPAGTTSGSSGAATGTTGTPSGTSGAPKGPAVRIGTGDYATNSSAVTLHLTWPTGATSAVVANDATFDTAGTATTVGAGATTVPWTLPTPAAATTSGTTSGVASSGGTVAAPTPDTVYVQFLGAPGGTVTVSAKTVLDETVPTLTTATLLPQPKGSAEELVKVVASDPVSGIAAVETSVRPAGGVTTAISPLDRRGYPELDTVVSPKGSAVPRYARVESAAGTWSSWSPVTPEMLAVTRAHGGQLVVAPGKAPLTLRGFDFQPLSATKVAGKLQYANITFNTDHYRPALARAVLRRMAGLGYNAVRVFVNVNQVGNPTGRGLDSAYVANVADFLTQATTNGIRVLLCTGDLPTNGGFMAKPNAALGGTNAYFLNPADLAGKARYLADLVAGLRADGAPLADVLWELAGEQDWNNHEAPLSLKHGRVRTAAGVFNMASSASRAAMENANLQHWVNVLSAKLHALVPGSLVGVGIYAPLINDKRPGWTVRPGPLFARSSKNDFVDIHVYSNLGSQSAQMKSFDAGATTKVLVMGEFGAARSAFSSPAAGAKGEVSWQHQSCHLGVHLSGWLLWTWNSYAQKEYWTALDGGGAIEKAMAPKHHPNACA